MQTTITSTVFNTPYQIRYEILQWLPAQVIYAFRVFVDDAGLSDTVGRSFEFVYNGTNEYWSAMENENCPIYKSKRFIANDILRHENLKAAGY